jgi:hypothetical protein
MSAKLSPARWRTPWSVTLFFALACVPYTCVFPYLSFNNPNENVRLYMTMALVEQHSFQIDALVDRYGWVNDMARLAGKDGVEHDYSLKAPGTSYLGVPFYWAFTKIAPRFGHTVPTAEEPPEVRAWWMRSATLVLRLFVVQLPSFAFLVWFERWLRGVTSDPVLRLTAVAATGLGTTYFAYALMFASHTLFAVTTFVSFGLITSERAERKVGRRRASRAFLAGLFAGLATLIEYQSFPLSVILALFAVITFRRLYPLVAFGAGAALSAGALMFFQWRCFGGPFTAGYKSAENSDFADWHKQGFYGLTHVDWQVFRDLATQRTFGFFSTSPFMWLSIAALLAIVAPSRRGRVRPKRLPLIVASVMMLTLWLMISAAVNWRGGWTVGPRLLGAAPPFFAFAAVAGLERVAASRPRVRALLRGVAGGLALAGVCTLGLVAMFYNSMPEDIVRPVADLVWPLVRLRFVPYHAGDLVGLHSPLLYFVPVGCLLGAPLIALLARREKATWMAIRLVTASVAFDMGMAPTLAETDADAKTAAEGWRKEFSKKWEPTGRDAIAVGQARAEESSRNQKARAPCLWLNVSDIERSLGWVEEADRDFRRSLTGRTRPTLPAPDPHCDRAPPVASASADAR